MHKRCEIGSRLSKEHTQLDQQLTKKLKTHMTGRQLEQEGYRFIFRHRDHVARWFDAYSPDKELIPGSPFRGHNVAKLAARIHFFAIRGLPAEEMGQKAPELLKIQRAIIHKVEREQLGGGTTPVVAEVGAPTRYRDPEPVGKHTPRLQRDRLSAPPANLTPAEVDRLREAVALVAAGEDDLAARKGVEVLTNSRVKTVIIRIPTILGNSPE